MDAVCNGRENWDVFLAEENGEIAAALPYFLKKRMGLTYITMPLLTQHNGIWQKKSNSEKAERRISRENKLYKQIVDQIEALKISMYQQCFSPDVMNWHPFSWKNYRQNTLYTFRIDHPYQLDEAVRNFSKSTKRNIKAARQVATIHEFDDLELFYQLNTHIFSSKKMNNPVSFALLERLYTSCKENNAVKMLCAKDKHDTVCAAILLVYDATTVYSLMSGLQPEKRHLNLVSALDFEGIKFACETGRRYDFEGSMLEGVANYNRAFGAQMKPYYSMKKVLEKRPGIRQYLLHRLYMSRVK